jgi:hypothetical protein
VVPASQPLRLTAMWHSMTKSAKESLQDLGKTRR